MLDLEEVDMQCKEFKCVYEIDGECEAVDGECIGDLCENYGECIECQQRDVVECDGRPKRRCTRL